MILGAKTRKIMLFLITLFFAAMVGSRFFQMAKTTSSKDPYISKAPAVKTEKATLSKTRKENYFFAKVKTIVDGDTIVTEKGEKIRYLGIDTPEFKEPFFNDVKEMNKDLTKGHTLRIEPCQKRTKDKYGRTLAFVFAKGKNVSKELLREGMGRVYSDADCNGNREKALWKTMINAYESKRGIWKKSPRLPIFHKEAINNIGLTRKIKGKITDVVKGENSYYAHFDDKWKTTGFSIRIPISPENNDSPIVNIQSLIGKEMVIIGKIEKWNYGPFITLYSKWQFVKMELSKDQ